MPHVPKLSALPPPQSQCLLCTHPLSACNRRTQTCSGALRDLWCSGRSQEISACPRESKVTRSAAPAQMWGAGQWAQACLEFGPLACATYSCLQTCSRPFLPADPVLWDALPDGQLGGGPSRGPLVSAGCPCCRGR